MPAGLYDFLSKMTDDARAMDGCIHIVLVRDIYYQIIHHLHPPAAGSREAAELC